MCAIFKHNIDSFEKKRKLSFFAYPKSGQLWDLITLRRYNQTTWNLLRLCTNTALKKRCCDFFKFHLSSSKKWILPIFVKMGICNYRKSGYKLANMGHIGHHSTSLDETNRMAPSKSAPKAKQFIFSSKINFGSFDFWLDFKPC
jgi:hypothetical protein